LAVTPDLTGCIAGAGVAAGDPPELSKVTASEQPFSHSAEVDILSNDDPGEPGSTAEMTFFVS